MPRITWNEIQDRAVEFAAKWQGETYEKGESQSFWADFLSVYDIDRRRQGALFEYAIKKLGGAQGFVDMFWPGKLLAEQKSAGRNLTKASVQAMDYLHTMPDHDLPQGVVVSDFGNFQYFDLETSERTDFTLQDFPKHVRLFGFLIEDQSKKLAEEDPVNRKAAEAMARLHNELRDNNYSGHDLELLLVRLVFCMFADDSGIFERQSFENYLRNRTNVDGSDFGPRLVKLFEVLNDSPDKRSTNLDEDLAGFEYINGGLFAEPIRIPDFNRALREQLLQAMSLDWSVVSPAIFGSMFQGVMDEKARRDLGAHYTSEKNILRVIKPLFLDALYEEFAGIRRSKVKLARFHDKLASLKFLDPACGCGNFLVITYRELRRLEHKVIEARYGKSLGMFDVGEHGVVRSNVDQMYGIEIEEFPALIAETAMWLTDHQMNMEFSKQSGEIFKRLPLTKKATIVNANALQIPWQDVVSPATLNYILGNPPFVGQTYQSKEQKEEVAAVLNGIEKTGVLDFVSAWYGKAADMMSLNTSIETALVSTNSITQGEQIGILWGYLLGKGVHINFAHRTFKWTNDASGVAAVHCVIIGFSLKSKAEKRLFEYSEITSEPIEVLSQIINPYLLDAPSVLLYTRLTSVSLGAPRLINGGKPTEGGNLLLSEDERQELIAIEPAAEKYIRPFSMGAEFINGGLRWCLWLEGVSPAELRSMPLVLRRVEAVRQMRLASKKEATKILASSPTLFGERRTSDTNYLAIPKVSSENREYIPIGYLDAQVVAGDKLFYIPNAKLYEFAILTSRIHMSWMRVVCGRLKSDYSYSNTLVYNNFPWPESVTDEQRERIGALGQAVLDARLAHPGSTLADLYDPLTMPADLLRAHKALDRAVDRLYRAEAFADDAERVALLFERYTKLIQAAK